MKETIVASSAAANRKIMMNQLLKNDQSILKYQSEKLKQIKFDVDIMDENDEYYYMVPNPTKTRTLVLKNPEQ